MGVAQIAIIVNRALALEPEARFASAREMYGAIRACLPQGHALEESAFVSLSPEARAVAAPRASPVSGPTPVAAISQTAPSSAQPQVQAVPQMSQPLAQAPPEDRAVLLGGALRTVAGFGRTNSGSGEASEVGSRRRSALAIAVLAALGVVAGTVAAIALVSQGWRSTGAASSAGTFMPTPPRTSTPRADPQPAATQAPTGSTPSIPTTSVDLLPRVSQDVASLPHPGGGWPKAAAAGPATHAPATSAPRLPVVPAPNCDIPFTIDANGIKHPRPECP